MALVMNLPVALTSPGSLPKHYLDDILSSGTLMLWEPGSPINPVSAAPAAPVLNSGRTAISTMPNLASGVSSLVDTTAFTATGSISSNTLTITAAGSKNIQIGDAVTGSGVTAGTYVATFGTGTGGTGTYSLNNTMTVSSEVLTFTPGTDMIVFRNDGAVSASNADMLVELSAKKALSVITSQSTMVASRQFSLRLPGPIKKYMQANPSHTYAVSAWYRITRAATTNTGPYIALKRSSGANSGWLNVGKSGPQSIASIANNFVAVGARNTVGMVQERLANPYVGTALTNNSSDFLAALFGFASVDGAYGDGGRNASMSAVVYRLTLEDLTVSGRTFAQFGAIDDALYALMFAAGGRYNGDTYTAVTALP